MWVRCLANSISWSPNGGSHIVSLIDPVPVNEIVVDILPTLEAVVSNIIKFNLSHLRLLIPRFQVYHHPRERFECLVAAVAFHVSRILLCLVLLTGQVSAPNVIRCSIGITVTVLV